MLGSAGLAASNFAESNFLLLQLLTICELLLLPRVVALRSLLLGCIVGYGSISQKFP
jgi:hypothetical protein